jgi:aminopeptidase N
MHPDTPREADRRALLKGALALPAIGWPGMAQAAVAADPLTGPGISLALAQRRAAQIARVRYAISLDVTAADRAVGSVVIRFDRVRDSGDLVLDFRGMMLTGLEANGVAIPATARRDGHLVLPARVLKTGANSVLARFETPIASAGAAIIRFKDPADGRTYLYTLLVPSDANLLFPCFDQPDLKARIRWDVVAPDGWTVIANGPVAAKTPQGAATRWRFAETAPISTYLAAFAAGPWVGTTSAPAGEQPITLYARHSRAAEVDAETQLATNRAAVRWLADWFGIAFPFAKLDLVLAPAFPFGGMEHVGAVFYNEDRFVFREPPTLPQRLAPPVVR